MHERHVKCHVAGREQCEHQQQRSVAIAGSQQRWSNQRRKYEQKRDVDYQDERSGPTRRTQDQDTAAQPDSHQNHEGRSGEALAPGPAGHGGKQEPGDRSRHKTEEHFVGMPHRRRPGTAQWQTEGPHQGPRRHQQRGGHPCSEERGPEPGGEQSKRHAPWVTHQEWKWVCMNHHSPDVCFTARSILPESMRAYSVACTYSVSGLPEFPTGQQPDL